MDYRRYYGLRPSRPLGESTFMAPQLENYSLFAISFLDLKKKLCEEVQEGAQSQPKKSTKTKTKGKPKQEEKVVEESAQTEDNFGIILNVATVKPEDLSITPGVGNEIEVKVQQTNVCLEAEGMTFSRSCCYKYELPDDIDKDTLVALRTSDDYLIILPRHFLRKDLLKESVNITKKDEKPSEISTSKASGSGDKDEKSEESKDSKSEEPEIVFHEGNKPIPVHVTRMLRPGLDILLLRKYVSELESYVSVVRKFIENSSFVTPNSKTAERVLGYNARKQTESFFAEEMRARRLGKEPTPESGYTTSEPSSENVSEDSTDSTKSAEASGESRDSESR